MSLDLQPKQIKLMIMNDKEHILLKTLTNNLINLSPTGNQLINLLDSYNLENEFFILAKDKVCKAIREHDERIYSGRQLLGFMSEANKEPPMSSSKHLKWQTKMSNLITELTSDRL